MDTKKQEIILRKKQQQKMECDNMATRILTNKNGTRIFLHTDCWLDCNKSVFSAPENSNGLFTYGIIQSQWSQPTQKLCYKIKFECLRSAHSAIGVGVVTNNTTKTNIWLFKANECGISYHLYVSNDSKTSGIYHFDNGKVEKFYCIGKRTPKSGKWTSNVYAPNETMKIKLNMKSYELMFFINSKQIGRNIKIKSNIPYYPAIAYNTVDGIRV
eukprot:506193_1